MVEKEFIRYAWREAPSWGAAVSILADDIKSATETVLNKQERESLAKVMLKCSCGTLEVAAVTIEWKRDDIFETTDVLYRIS